MTKDIGLRAVCSELVQTLAPSHFPVGTRFSRDYLKTTFTTEGH
ncbi:hypothetical protein [Pseudoalteromonas rhizosphaerae]